jgi:tetratricopeptide (TPR) repeat protein
MDSMAYDVFISYSSQDKAWVRQELLTQLEARGLKACIDFRDFKRGAPTVKEIERALQTSRKTLLILTPAYLASAWTELETLSLQTRDPSNRELRLIPLLKEKCDLPPSLGILTYVDFAAPEDLELAWRQLLTALGAPPVLEPAAEPRREQWFLAHPYAMPPNFTGRLAERKLLNDWLNADGDHPLFVLRALGGFGKSALAWHWLLHDVEPMRRPRAVWWSFYEGDASFESFLLNTLAYLGIDPRGLGPRQQADALLSALHSPNLLLILDGFERALRAFSGMNAAYQGDEALHPLPLPTPVLASGEGGGRGEGEADCLSPHADYFLRALASLPGILHGKVLMTTRLRPRPLETHGQLLQGCHEEELTQMRPADAVAFFHAQGIRGGRVEIEDSCNPYGYHPLSLRLLAGLIVNDLQQPGDIAAARHLDVSGDLIQRQNHVLKYAYESLTPARRQLLSRIACFRTPVAYEALEILSKQLPPLPAPRGFLNRLFSRSSPATQSTNPQADLHDLIARGLLHHDRRVNRYDLHPIVRRYAYDRLGSADRTAAHTRLRDYFAAVPELESVQKLDDLMPVIELYHHTVRARHYDEAWILFRDRFWRTLYYQLGAYQMQIELLQALFTNGEDRPPQLRDEAHQAHAMNELANSYSLSGQPRRAVPLYEGYIAISEKRSDKQNLAIGLGNLAFQQIPIGVLRAAEANLRRSITLCQEIKDEFWEAVGRYHLGRLLPYRGAWDESEGELAAALALFEKGQDVQSQGIVWAYRALRALLVMRAGVGTRGGEALSAARRVLELADEWARTEYPVELDYVRAHWLLGAAHRVNGDLVEADRHLSEALTRCRSINLVDHEADILLDLARLREAQNEREEALRLAQEALTIAERSEYVLQGADVNIFLAQMALEAGDKSTALTHAREACRLATCDGPPDYTYKVAYEEAGRLVEELTG